jgi:hypothetical protein
MPLTAKGEKILSKMREEYGSEKKAKSVLYASKNKGKITGIDAADEYQPKGGKCGVSGRKLQSCDDEESASASSSSISPRPVGGLPATSRQSSVPASMDKLPTVDQFRRRFKDAVRAGLPLSKCMELGTVWNGSNSGDVRWQSTEEGFHKSVSAAMDRGLPAKDAIRHAVDEYQPKGGKCGVSGRKLQSCDDEAPDQKLDLGRISGIGVPMGDSAEDPKYDRKIAGTVKWLTMKPPTHVAENKPLSQKTNLGQISGDEATIDARRHFFKGCKDALDSGKSYRDAIASALDQYGCACGESTSGYIPPDGHVI